MPVELIAALLFTFKKVMLIISNSYSHLSFIFFIVMMGPKNKIRSKTNYFINKL
jgi:hypothetical protein